MVKLNEKFVTDHSGRATDVILDRRGYLRLLDYVEDLEDRLEIKRRKKVAKFFPWEQAKADLQRAHKS
jgi:hypothetical protein